MTGKHSYKPAKLSTQPPIETAAHVRRRINDLATLAMPARWAALPGIIRDVFVHRDAAAPLREASGKAGADTGFIGRAKDASPAVIAHAARRGEFLRFVMGRACWFCEDMLPARFISTGALAVRGSVTDMNLSLDSDFRTVVQQAARESIAAGRAFCPGDTGVAIFEAAHVAGFAHCLEIRDQGGALCAGLYGLAQGRGFVILEIFAATPALQKLALDALETQLAQWRYRVLAFSPYARVSEDALAALGFSSIARVDFAEACGGNPSAGRHGRWCFEHRIASARNAINSAA